MADNEDTPDDPDEGLVREVETLKGRVDNIEHRVNDLHDMFDEYMGDEEDE